LEHLPPVEIKGLASETLVEAVRRVLTDLTRLIGYLNLIETAPPNVSPPEQVDAIFITVHAEALVLIDYIEDYALNLEGISAKLHETLDSISFALKHELRRAYHGGSPALNAQGETSHQPPALNDTHDLLRNCFQQSFLMLGRLFNPTLDAEEIFNDLQTRHEQSLILWGDLIALLQCVRQAEQECNQKTIAYLIELLKQFREGSMRYLMQKDWNPFEEFAGRVMNCRRVEEVQPILNQLDCYLEILLNHIRLRAVLNNNDAAA
jgi:hypothetical protein